MPGRIDTRLAELGIALPQPTAPKVAKILPFAISGNLLFLSGALPQWEGDIRYTGKVGRDFTLEQGRDAARLSMLNVLTQARVALAGDLDRIGRFIKLGGFVNCTGDFSQVAEVVNGASELVLDVWGDAGRHSRIAVGAANMPMGVAVEIEAVCEIHA